MLKERLQILIDSDQRRRLEAEAGRTGASVGQLVRDAIDSRYPNTSEDRRQAAERLLSAEPMVVPETIEDLKEELTEIRGARL